MSVIVCMNCLCVCDCFVLCSSSIRARIVVAIVDYLLFFCVCYCWIDVWCEWCCVCLLWFWMVLWMVCLVVIYFFCFLVEMILFSGLSIEKMVIVCLWWVCVIVIDVLMFLIGVGVIWEGVWVCGLRCCIWWWMIWKSCLSRGASFCVRIIFDGCILCWRWCWSVRYD